MIKVHPHVKRTAWASSLLLTGIGLVAAIFGVGMPYQQDDIVMTFIVIMTLLMLTNFLLVPEESEVKEKVVYKYADERAPKGFDTQA